MRIIPAIDIIDGKCVRLTKGDYKTKKVYRTDPLEVAKEFEGAGIKYLHLVDLDGAKAGHIINYSVLERLAGETNLQIDFGGGIKTEEDIRLAFESGAAQITGGSIAVKKPALFLDWIKRYGPDRIILGADCSNQKICISGWTEQVEISVVDFIIEYQKKGIKKVICTDIAKDGMLAGPSIKLYQNILKTTDIQLIASGGVSSIEELRQLKEIGCEGAIIGKGIYEGQISLKELVDF